MSPATNDENARRLAREYAALDQFIKDEKARREEAVKLQSLRFALSTSLLVATLAAVIAGIVIST